MQQRVSISRSCRARLYSLYWFAEGAQNKAASQRLVDMRSRVESMLVLRDKGIDSLFSTLDSVLPPLVASGMPAHQAIVTSNGNPRTVFLSVYITGLGAPNACSMDMFAVSSSVLLQLCFVLCWMECTVCGQCGISLSMQKHESLGPA